MTTIHTFIILIATIRAVNSVIKDNQVLSFIFIINLMTEVITQVFIAYKFPLLFVSLMIRENPLFKRVARRLLTKLANKV